MLDGNRVDFSIYYATLATRCGVHVTFPLSPAIQSASSTWVENTIYSSGGNNA